MEHCRDDVLALLALGEPAGSTDISQHLSGCASCRSRLDSLARTVTVARSAPMADELTLPPAELWESIAANVRAEASSDPVRLRTVVSTARSAPARHRRVPWVLTAAAAGLIIGTAGSTVLLTRDAPSEVIASAQLSPVGEADVTGTALLTRTESGQFLSVDVAGLVTGAGYYEVWMATPDAVTMLALGALASDQHGNFPVPPGVTTAEYPVVDVSFEQVDGNPAHSVVSVVRGTLTS
ncbi:MAG: anti-sigma factor [Actinobacteria bacterium]|uniref:Unannotated protein n=1 Tax=freshwater metagenome TaxID=449393 RepID=A0A6J7J8T1_9ZZZZ|nr:anti-sigma factor [Actinomycetota bacterium]